ncbi:hypothetical protein UFOVP119_85 [uncultured Caudovirales phage]|uniref:Uncharacterized protein n=1 Tax=uncultured Caudovirales phage TaxID=2100421 RepID=A0A6J5L7T9_9CAUD|nr:hypothetical protein UFOVP119_85 [uncultured Caudovirales phage]
MSNPSWPSQLPAYVLEGSYQEATQDQTIESQMESGPAKIRRRFTKLIKKFTIQMAMTEAQVETYFDPFWQTTCLGGSIPFDWVHPRTRASTTFRFRNPAPTYNVSGGGGTILVNFTIETA